MMISCSRLGHRTGRLYQHRFYYRLCAICSETIPLFHLLPIVDLIVCQCNYVVRTGRCAILLAVPAVVSGGSAYVFSDGHGCKMLHFGKRLLEPGRAKLP